MDRRAFLRALGLTAAATAALLVPGTEAWAEQMEPRRRWWQGWGGAKPVAEQYPFGEWGIRISEGLKSEDCALWLDEHGAQFPGVTIEAVRIELGNGRSVPAAYTLEPSGLLRISIDSRAMQMEGVIVTARRQP